MSLRDLGNERFKAGDYKEAEQYYTHAIYSHPTDPKLFSNRALTRIRLQDWRNAERDARKAIELYGAHNQASLKPHYYLAQALVEMRHTSEAMTHAQTAYKFCLETNDTSSDTLSRFILKTKQAHWQAKETTRLRELNHTLDTVEDLLQQQLEKDLEDVEHRFAKSQIGETGRKEEREDLDKEANERRKVIRTAFKDAKNQESSERIVPEYLIDAITFEVMHDPVITPSGQSYERVGLLQHIRQAGTDPMTREPLTESQLVSNVALRSACAEFLENNGWAVDY